MTIRFVVINGRPMMRVGVRSEFGHSGTDLVTVGEAADIEGAVAACHELRPDAAPPDAHLLGGRGGRGTGVSARCQGIEGLYFLALPILDSPENVVQVIRSDTRGYMTKSISTPELVEVIQCVASGDAVFSPRLAGFVLDASDAGQAAIGDNGLDLLSIREQEVMRPIARGCTYKGADDGLFISVKTMETHVSTVLCKLQLLNHNELTRWAMQRHIV